MTDSEKSNSKDMPQLQFAIVLEDIPEKWGMNVLQVLGRQTSAQVNLDGYGTVEARASC